MLKKDPEKFQVLWIDGGMETAHALVAGVRLIKDSLELTSLSPSDLESVADWEAFLSPFQAVVVVASCARGGEPETRRLLDEVRKGNIPVTVYTADPELRADLMTSGSLPVDVYESFNLLLSQGDKESVAEALTLLQNTVLGRETILSPLREQPSVMEYHPSGLPILPDGPSVAVVFLRRLWTDANLAGIDAIMAALANEGLRPFALHVETKGFAGFRLLDDLIEELEARRPAAVLSYTAFSMRNMARDAKEVVFQLKRLNVPWFVSPILQCQAKDWEQDPIGLSVKAQTMYVTLPEFDGRIPIPPTMGRSRPSLDPDTGIKLAWLKPIPERCAWAARLLRAYVDLAQLTNRHKRIALVLHNYPPNDGGLASAVGLDGPASAVAILKALQDRGYEVGNIPQTGSDLLARLTGGCSNDEDWLTSERLQTTPGFVGLTKLEAWEREMPEEAAEAVWRKWGPPPGDAFYTESGIPIPGFLLGNVLVALQPPRGQSNNLAAEIHSKILPPNHAYLAFYRWIRDEFGAHAVIHLGKHGSLEWLPGKATGLCRSCFSELVLGPVPHFYPYIVNSFSEGAAAKRRTHGVIIDHMPPPLSLAGGRPEWVTLGRSIDAARQAGGDESDKAAHIVQEAVELALEMNFHSDLDLSVEEANQRPSDFVEAVHNRLEQLQGTFVSDGLHVLGQPPRGARLARFLEIIARNDLSGVQRLHPAVAEMLKVDQDSPESDREISKTAAKAIEGAMAGQWTGNEAVDQALKSVLGILKPKVDECTDELKNLMAGLEGKYIPAGPSGAPTRSDTEALPTGRNFFGVDPRLLPTRTAWKTGSALGRSLLEKYAKDGKKFPESVAMVGFAGNQIRTGGDDLAQALWLMGLEPVWSEPSGFVKDVVPIPLQILGRPRIDVVLRVSGMFRDSLAEAVELIDLAVSKAAALDEPPEKNYIRKHIRSDVARAIREGLRDEDALKRASFRVYSSAPGAYGAGISGKLNRGEWTNRDDLSRDFIQQGMYAYGRKGEALPAREDFERRLAEVEVVVKNWDHLEHDLLDSDDFFSYFGGLAAATEYVRGESVELFIGKDNDPTASETVSFHEEQTRVIRAQVTNPKWLAGLRRHGYAGGARMAQAVSNAFGLAASADRFENWMYEDLAQSILFDEQNREFLESRNPLALQTAAGVLIDAVRRNMWHTNAETLAKLEAAFLQSETILEGDE